MHIRVCTVCLHLKKEFDKCGAFLQRTLKLHKLAFVKDADELFATATTLDFTS